MAAFDQTERYTDWSESHQQAHDASRASAQHAGPVIVEKNEPDQNTAQVNPALKLARLTDKGAVQWIQVPVIKSAPLLQLGGGGVHITIPVQKGDEGLAIYADRGIDNWWAQGGVQQQDQSRMNQWSDAFIIPGFHSQPNKLKNVDGTSMQMRTTDGKTSFGFNPSQGGSMTMTAPNNPTTMVGKGFNTNVQSQSHNVPNGVSYTTPSINVSGKVDAKGGFFVNGRPVGSGGGGGGGDGGGGASSSAGETPPTTPIIGDFWWDSVGGQLYIWYNDNTSSQWVAATNQPGPKGDPGTPGATGARGPTGSQGPAGAQGPIGPIGPQGVPGTPSTVPGPVGPPGPQGAEGVQGPIGPIGAQGYPGTGAYVTGPGLKIDLGTYPATMDVATPYLPLYGGTMTGVLVLAGPPLNPLEAATKAYTDAAVAGLAPLASPVFTGNPTAPTPPTADNDTSIATTAWVNLQGFLVAAGASYLPISGGTLTGALVLPSGTVTATSLNFGTPGTGIWTSAAATQINFAAGGLNRVAISSASVNCAVPIIAPLGTVAAPSLTFVGDTTSGFFRKVAGSVSISATNSEVMNWAAASKTTTAYGPLLLAANPSAPLEATAKQYVDAADALALSITAAASTYLTIANAASTYLTIANAASTYAPLASPLFTGNPRGPTPATADSSPSLATTAWVKSQNYAPASGAGYLPLTGGTLTGYLITAGQTNNGWFYTGINSPAYPTSFGGLAISWNFNVGQGDVDFWNCYTLCSGYNSFYWYQLTTAGSAATKVMSVGPSGLNVGGAYIQNNGTFLSTSTAGGFGQYHMAAANNANQYGSMWYNDGTNTYLLLTNNNDAMGIYNGLRPWLVNNASGVVSMNQGVIVNGGSINLQNGSSGNTFITYNGGNYVQMFDDGNGHIECNTQLWLNGNTGQDVQVGGNLRCAHQIYMPLDNWLWMGGYASLLQSSDGNFYIGDGAARPTRLRGTTVSIDQPVYFNGYTRVQPGAGDSFRVYSPSSGHARLWHEVTGIRVWSQGAINNGWWYLADESAGAVRFSIDTGGNASFGGNALACGVVTTTGINSSGAITGQGNLTMNNNGHYYWIDNTGRQWCIYGDGGIFRVYNNSTGDVLSVHQDGGLYCNGLSTNNGGVSAGTGPISGGILQAGGLTFSNNGGWWWTGSPIHTDGTMECGRINIGGHGVYDSGGWEYHDAGIHAGELYSRDNIWCAGTVSSGGNMSCGHDLTVQGWYYGSGGGAGGGAAQIKCWPCDWGAMSFALASGGYLFTSGDQGSSGFNYTPNAGWSDARLKLNIRDSEIDALAILCAIPVRAFDWTSKGRELMPQDNGPSVSCGLVAQELEELIPDAVALVPVIGDLAGERMRCLVPEQLDAYYIRAIQQLTDELAAVKARLTQLEH